MSNETSIKLLNEVRAKTARGTDYAVSKSVGMSPQRLTMILKGGKHLSDDLIVSAAEYIGIDPISMVAKIHQEKSRTEPERLFWKRLANQASRISAMLMLVAGLVTHPSDALASASGANKQAQDLPIVMIMRSYILEL